MKNINRASTRGHANLIIPVLVFIFSLIQLFGWIMKNEFLIRLLSDSSAIQINTLISLLLFSVSTMIFHLHYVFSAKLLGGVTIVWIVVCFGGDPIKWNEIFSYLYSEEYRQFFIDHHHNVAPETSASLLLLSASLLLHIKGRKSHFYFSSGILSGLAGAIGGIALLGFALKVQIVNTSEVLPKMAFGSAFSIVLHGINLLVLNEAKMRQNQSFYKYWHSTIVTLTGFLVATLLWASVKESENKNIRLKFERDVELRTEILQNALDNHLSFLNSVRNFFQNSEFVSQEEFDNFVRSYVEEPGSSIVAIDWSPKIKAEDKDTFEKEIGTKIKMLTQDYTLIERTPASLYFPVRYTTSDRNYVGGFDHFSEPVRAEAMEKALKQGVVLSSRPLRLFRTGKKDKNKSDFLIFYPVFTKSEGSVHEDKLVAGFVVGVFQISKIIEHAFSRFPPVGLNIEMLIHDENEPLYLHCTRLDKEGCESSTLTRQLKTVNVAGQKWDLAFSPSEEYVSKLSTQAPHVVFLFAMCPTILTAAYIYLIRRKNEMLLISKDQLELRNTELKDLRLKAENATQAKSQFLAHMSHEIRTPLTSIIGFTEESLHKNLSQAELSNHQKAVLRNAKHLLRLINDILDLSKIEARKLEIEYQKVDLFRIVDDVIQMLKPRAEQKNISLSVCPTFPIPKFINSDPTRLKQVIFNLTDNALKFTKQGTIEVQLACDYSTSIISISVKDSGVGMTDDQKERLFSSFTQGDSSISRKYGGTGLGLFITKQLTEMLGGDIKVDSTVGIGSVFTARIAAGEIPENENLFSIPELEELDDHVPFEVERFKGSILLAEDMLDTQRLLSSIFKEHGLDVQLASDGREAVDIAAKRSFDIIFMDMQMPDIDGIQATQTLRKKGYYGPVIALTANLLKNKVEECISAGCDGCLGKPFERKALSKILSLYLPKEDDLRKDTPGSDFQKESDEFIRMFERRLTELENALNNGDFLSLSKMAHKLAGAAAFAYREVYENLTRLETESSDNPEVCASIIKDLRQQHVYLQK